MSFYTDSILIPVSYRTIPVRAYPSMKSSPYYQISHWISPNLIESHQISLYFTKPKCKSRTSCRTILQGWGETCVCFKKTLLYLALSIDDFVFLTISKSSQLKPLQQFHVNHFQMIQSKRCLVLPIHLYNIWCCQGF